MSRRVIATAHLAIRWIRGARGSCFGRFTHPCCHSFFQPCLSCKTCTIEFLRFYFLIVLGCRSTAGPNGTTIVGMNVTFNSFCGGGVFFYLTNAPTTINIGRVAVPIDPRFLKLSVTLDCPWKRTLLNYNLPTAQASDPLYLYSRKTEIPVLIEFQFSTAFSGFPSFKRYLDPISWPKYDEYVNYMCYNSSFKSPVGNTKVYHFQDLAPGFDYAGETGVYLPSSDFAAGVYFLGWAVADGLNETRVTAEVNGEDIILDSVRYYASAPVLVGISYADCIPHHHSQKNSKIFF